MAHCAPSRGQAAETGNTVSRGETMPHTLVRIAATLCQPRRRALEVR